MESTVGRLKEKLEQLGEYVVLANIGWFAIYPRTWKMRLEAAQRSGRQGPNLIVFRTNGSIPNDHHVIPYAVIRELLTEATITESKVRASRRWNLTLKHEILHVSHGSDDREVGAYRGAALMATGAGSEVVVERSVQSIGDGQGLVAVEGIAREATILTRKRSRKLRGLALIRAAGICEACGIDFSLVLGGKGSHVLQVHHRRQLALLEVPTPMSTEDLAVVCANCHAIIHSDPKTAMPVEVLHALWATDRVKDSVQVRHSRIRVGDPR